MNLIRRIVFSIGIGNGDMHAKNWSVLYHDGRTPSLAPAYDYLSTIVYLPDDDLGMNLSGEKVFSKVDMAQLVRLATRALLSAKIAERAVIETVTRMRDVWPAIKDTLPLEDQHRAAISAYMARMQLFRFGSVRASHREGPPSPRDQEFWL